jgi:hypothetical protein
MDITFSKTWSYTYEEFGSKMLYIHFCVFEKNAGKILNLLGNALEKY